MANFRFLANFRFHTLLFPQFIIENAKIEIQISKESSQIYFTSGNLNSFAEIIWLYIRISCIFVSRYSSENGKEMNILQKSEFFTVHF